MLTPRLIPCLLVHERNVVKTVRYASPHYVGDPINVVRIFNEKEVDELLVVDIDATGKALGPNLELVRSLTAECFMPMTYGGGIRDLADIEQLFFYGVEKVALNRAAWRTPQLVSEAAERFGGQSIVVAVDLLREGGEYVLAYRGRERLGTPALAYLKESVARGAGEVLVNFVDRDGTYAGYDHEYLRQLCAQLPVPVVACGGASSLDDIARLVWSTGAAAAVGSCFVYLGRSRAVLIQYPSREELDAAGKKYRDPA